MQALGDFWARSDATTVALAGLLLAMSVAAWVQIILKGLQLRRAQAGLARGLAAFWAADTPQTGLARLGDTDSEGLLHPLALAALATAPATGLQADAPPAAQLTRRLRDALLHSVARLQRGQVLLASVGSTAPFVGLLGTVWGVYGALLGVAGEGAPGLDRIAGPIGEALVMTAAGIAVAVPAVLAYNAFGQRVAACEAVLEGFAHDLRAWALGTGDSAPADAA